MRLRRACHCAVIAGGYLILRALVPLLKPGLLHPGLGIFLSIGVLMLVQLALVSCVAGMQLRSRAAALLTLPSGVVVVGLTCVLAGTRIAAPPALEPIQACRDLALLLFAAFLGCLVSFIIREPNILLPVAVLAGFVDFWSVTWGPLSHVLERAPAAVQVVSIQMPAAAPGMPATMVGMGDFVFLALFFGAMYRFGMNVRGAFWLGYALLTLSMLVVVLVETALPALLPMSLAVVVANKRHFKLNRQEMLAMLYVGMLLLALLIVSGVFLFRR